MKAIIMAGGRGTRLMPISALSPKPMTLLMGLPLLEHIVELLRRNGFTQLCMTLGHMPDQIREYFGNGDRFGVSIRYEVEQKPLGTAGGVKACSDFYGDEDFLVISGDAACDFELSRLADRHEKLGAALTMALCSHPEPLSYGTVLTDPDGKVRCFIEKPDWPHVVTDLVNTGIYVVSPRVMELVAPDTETDFAKDVFPRLTENGEPVYGLPMEGYWCDVGNPESYLRCCMDALDSKLTLSKTASGTFDAESRSFLCTGAKISDSAIIEHSIIHSGASVGRNARIRDSVVSGDAGDGCDLEGAVICPRSSLGPGEKAGRGEVVSFTGNDAHERPAESPRQADSGGSGLCRELPCAHRAAVMREISSALWETGADFSDGITLSDGGCKVHIRPMADEQAISVEADGGRARDRIAACGKYCELAEKLKNGIDSSYSI